MGGLIAIIVLGLVMKGAVDGAAFSLPVFWVVGFLVYLVLHYFGGAMLGRIVMSRYPLEGKLWALSRMNGSPRSTFDIQFEAKIRGDPLFMGSKLALWVGKWWLVLAVGLMAAS